MFSPNFHRLRIGLLGGSFNPAHAGHRAMSLHALRALRLDQVWWLVSPQNPLKSSQGMKPLAARLAEAKTMARHPRIRVSDIESRLATVYTVDTLKALKRRFPKAHFVWLMGADNMQQMPHWHQWTQIFAHVPVAVFRRPAYAAGRGRGKAAQRFDKAWVHASQGKNLALMSPPRWLVLDNRLNRLSATQIRAGQPSRL